MEVWKIIFLSKWVIYRFHVNLPGCIALDCEGEHLGPAGNLALVTLAAMDGRCWIFDWRQGFNPFPWGLKQLLEDASVVKLTFKTAEAMLLTCKIDSMVSA